MDQYDYIKVSLVDLLAYFVKKFWVLFIGALVGMVLLLSFHYISSNTDKNVEAYEKSLSKYNAELLSREQLLDNLKLRLGFLSEVESNSPFFSDGTIYVSKVSFTVDPSDGVITSNNENGFFDVAPEVTMFWKNMDFSSLVGSNLDNDIEKASIVFVQAGHSVSFSVYSEDKNKAEKYSSSILDAYINYFDGRDYFSLVSKTISTSIASKQEIANIVSNYVAEKTELQTNIFDKEEEIEALKKEVPSKYRPLKTAVIGFFACGVIVAIILGTGFALRNPVTSSFSVEKAIAIPFLGALFIDKGFFARFARKILVERSFRKYDDSLDFLKSSFTTKAFTDAIKTKGITIISSLKDAGVEEKSNEVMELLKEEGYDVTFISDTSENPLAIKTIEEKEAVIFIERQWFSKLQLIIMNKDLAIKMGKNILGFIIC